MNLSEPEDLRTAGGPPAAVPREELAAFASRLAAAVARQEWIEEPARLPATMDEAYLVQDMAAEMRGDVPSGWKLGCTSEHVQELFRTDEPIAGRVYAREVYESPAVVRRVRPDRLIVEGEFVFRMGADLPPRERPYEEAEIVAAIATLHPGIEYVQSRLLGPATFNAIRSVADNAGFGSLIVGPAATGWTPADLPDRAVTMFADGERIGEGGGREVLGSPVTCLVWLVHFLNRRGQGLNKGDYVTTGACAGAQRVELGQTVVADFGALGTASVIFEL